MFIHKCRTPCGAYLHHIFHQVLSGDTCPMSQQQKIRYWFISHAIHHHYRLILGAQRACDFSVQIRTQLIWPYTLIFPHIKTCHYIVRLIDDQTYVLLVCVCVSMGFNSAQRDLYKGEEREAMVRRTCFGTTRVQHCVWWLHVVCCVWFISFDVLF